MYEFVETTSDHIDLLAENMRPEECEELEALTVFDIPAFLKWNLSQSVECWTCFYDGELVAVGGCKKGGSLVDSYVVPWMGTTPLVNEHKKDFLTCTKLAIKHWTAKYKNLQGVVDVRHTKSIRWAKWLGFTVFPQKVYNGVTYNKIELRA